MASKNFTVSKDGTGVTSGGGGQWNGGDNHHPIGKWDPGTGLSWRTRALLYAPVSFSGMVGITSAKLHVFRHNPAFGWHAHGSGTNPFAVRRMRKDWHESSFGTNGGSENNWGGDGTADTFIKDNDSAASEIDFSASSDGADGSELVIDITGIVIDWFNGSPNYGLELYSRDEDASNSAMEVYARESSGNDPFIEVNYTTNTAPNEPANMVPYGSNVSSSNRLTWEHDDPDANDKATKAEAYLYATDGTTVVAHSSGASLVADNGIDCSWTPAGMVSGNRYEWKARTYDGQAWGPYSPHREFYYEPSQPAPSLSSPAAGATVSTLTPTFAGTHNLSGDSTMAGAQVRVYAADGVTLVWDSGFFADTGSAFSKVYSGPALAWATAYQWQTRVQTGLGTWSAWSAKRTLTTDAAGSPKSPFPSGTKEDSATPHIGFDAAAGDSIQSWDYEVYGDDQTTLHASASGVTTDITSGTHVDHVYGGSALLAGQTYYIRFRYTTPSAQVSPWSGKQQFAVNAPPSAPTLVAPAAGASVTDLTPLLDWTFQDPDKADWGDTQAAYTIEVRNNATDALVATLTGTTATSRVYDGAALAYETPYKWRVKTDDGAGYGAFSSYRTFTPTQPPALTGVQVDPAGIDANGFLATPTPTIEWTYSSPGGKAQASYRVQAIRTADGFVAYDTGELDGDAASYLLPNGVLDNDTEYEFEVYALDSDGLASAAVDTTPLTTLFAPPAALTNVSTFADGDTTKITVAWDASVDPNFDHYEVWRRVYGQSDWTVLSDSLTDQGAIGFDDYTAALNVTYEYVVLQVSLEGTSLVQGDYAAITSGLTGIPAWFFVAERRDDLTCQLTWVTGLDEGVPIQQQKMDALGRPYKIVLEGLVLGSEGSLTLTIDRSEADLSDRIEALLRAQLPRVLIKSPRGKVYASKLGSIRRSPQPRGGIQLSIDYTEVEAV